MNEFDEECLNVFLENQSQLFEEAVAETLEDAEAFLEDCMAVVVENIDEVKEFLEEEGMDIQGMSDEELEEAAEVFPIPDGRISGLWKVQNRCSKMSGKEVEAAQIIRKLHRREKAVTIWWLRLFLGHHQWR